MPWQEEGDRSLDEPMSRFVICINKGNNPAGLILGKVYRTLPDASAEAHGMIRVIDEDKSEQDGFLYPVSMFAPIEPAEATERALTVRDRVSEMERTYAFCIAGLGCQVSIAESMRGLAI